MSDHKTEEKEMQDFIDEWMKGNEENVKMVSKTIRIDRSSRVYQTFFFNVMLPEHSEDEWMAYDVVSDLLCQGIDFGTPDEEDYNSPDDEYTIMDTEDK
jgi:hypothetical protein